jgi:hypothetical protein
VNYPFGIISLAHEPVNVTDFSIGSIYCVRHYTCRWWFFCWSPFGHLSFPVLCVWVFLIVFCCFVRLHPMSCVLYVFNVSVSGLSILDCPIRFSLTVRKRKYKLRLPIKLYYRICTLRHIRIEINHGSQNVFWVLTWIGGY